MGQAMTKFESELHPVIGIDATNALIAAYGGIRLFVPTTIALDHGLSFEIGHAKAVILAKTFGGCHLSPPIGTAREYQRIKNQACSLKSDGVSVNEIALRFNVTRRTVFSWIADKTAPSQELAHGN